MAANFLRELILQVQRHITHPPMNPFHSERYIHMRLHLSLALWDWAGLRRALWGAISRVWSGVPKRAQGPRRNEGNVLIFGDLGSGGFWGFSRLVGCQDLTEGFAN